MKKPLFVWIISIIQLLVGLLIIFSSVYLIVSKNQIAAPIIYIVLEIPYLIMTYFFFNLKKKCMTWIHISYGINAFVAAKARPISFIGIVIWWYILYKYVSKRSTSKNSIFT